MKFYIVSHHMKEVKAVSLVEAAERRPGASFGNHWSRAHRVPPP